MEYSRRNLFVFCCIISCLTMLSYLAGLSCELAWLLSNGGNLHVAAYLLCVLYFILFIASFVLIHGLATTTLMELISWAILIGILSIPELIFVVHMISEHWGIESVPGLTELIGYLVRLAINIVGLACIGCQASRWRSESQLQLAKILIDPTQAAHHHHYSMTHMAKPKSFDNFAFDAIECPPLSQTTTTLSKNEFNASAFGLNVEPCYGHYNHPNRSHSSYDLRMMNVGNPYLQYSRGIENPMLLQKLSHNKYDHNIYHTINFKPKEYAKPNVLQRKCISMENLKGASGGGGSGSGAAPGNSNSLRKSKESTGKMQCINISNPQLVNNSTLKSYYNMPFGYIYDVPYKNNSKMSLGTNGSDDVRGYRDVAL